MKNTDFKVKRSKVKVTSRLLLKPKMYHTYRTVRPTNFKIAKLVRRRSMLYELPRPAIKACEVGFLHAGGGILCRPNPAATQLVRCGRIHHLAELVCRRSTGRSGP